MREGVGAIDNNMPTPTRVYIFSCIYIGKWQKLSILENTTLTTNLTNLTNAQQ